MMQFVAPKVKPPEGGTLYAVALPRIESARHATAHAALRAAYRGQRRLAVQYVRLTLQMDTILETPDAPDARQWLEILGEHASRGAVERRAR